MKDMAKFGVTPFKNVRSKFRTLDGQRLVMAGLLAAGSSDLIGLTPVVITPDMVGQKIAVFTAMESKTATDRASDEQDRFIYFVKSNGGYAGIVRNSEDAKK